MLFKGIAIRRRIKKNEKKHYGAVDEPSLEQQFCKSDMIIV